MNPEFNEEQSIIDQARRGRKKALQQLFDCHADSLYAYIERQVNGSAQDIEDIWQDSMYSAFRNLSAFRGDSRFFTWLCSIAHRKIIDFYRNNNRPIHLNTSHGLEEFIEVLDKQPLPEEVIMDKEVHLKIIEVMADLPIEYRQVLLERYANNKSLGEIALKIKKSYKATESLLARARQALRQSLESNTQEISPHGKKE